MPRCGASGTGNADAFMSPSRSLPNYNDESSKVRLTRDGQGATLNWKAIAAAAAFLMGTGWYGGKIVSKIDDLTITSNEHSAKIGRIEYKLDELLIHNGINPQASPGAK